MESLISKSTRNTISISTDYQACKHSSLLTTLYGKMNSNGCAVVLGDTHGNSVLSRYQLWRYQYRGCFHSTDLPPHHDTTNTLTILPYFCSKTVINRQIPTDQATVFFRSGTEFTISVSGLDFKGRYMPRCHSSNTGRFRISFQL